MSRYLIPETNVALALHKVTHDSGASSMHTTIHHEHCVHKQLVCLSSTICSLVRVVIPTAHMYSVDYCQPHTHIPYPIGCCCSSDAKVRNTLCSIPCHNQFLKWMCICVLLYHIAMYSTLLFTIQCLNVTAINSKCMSMSLWRQLINSAVHATLTEHLHTSYLMTQVCVAQRMLLKDFDK